MGFAAVGGAKTYLRSLYIYGSQALETGFVKPAWMNIPYHATQTQGGQGGRLRRPRDGQDQNPADVAAAQPQIIAPDWRDTSPPLDLIAGLA